MRAVIKSIVGLAGITVVLVVAQAQAQAQAQIQVHETVLDNGMKILVKPDPRAPVVVSQVWYKVGSSYEPTGLTGISHVLEHMMFKGTKAVGPNQFSRIISENGGRENAFTGRDYTAYFQRLEKSRLEIALRLEADRMRNLLLPPAEFEKEVQVVMEERRLRTEDKPQSLTYERFNATSYAVNPYRNPIIGWMNDLENLRIEDLQVWYRRWYAPSNATLVVVGDVQPEQVVALAKKYFGPIKAESVQPPKQQVEPPPLGPQRLVVKVPAQLPYLIMGFHVPSLKTAQDPTEAYALEVLAGILDGGDSARLTRNLVRGKTIAVRSGAGYGLYSRLSEQFLLDGTPANGRTIDELETALWQEIEALRNEKVSTEELDRVKAQVVAAKVFEQDSMFYQAMQLGTLETVGLSWQLMDEYVERIRAVTPEQVQAVARKYLQRDRSTVAILDPQPMENAPTRVRGPAPSRH